MGEKKTKKTYSTIIFGCMLLHLNQLLSVLVELVEF